jgi:hypothetical protein
MKQNLNFIKSLRSFRSSASGGLSTEDTKKLVGMLLKDCFILIESCNLCGATETLYECPLFVNGHYNYDVKDIALELNKELKIHGFTTLFIKPRFIKISW